MLVAPQKAINAGEAQWHALYTRHQHEKTVAHVLSCKGFEVFLPLYWAVHRWKDRDKQVWLPLFPCYVFLHGGLWRQLDLLSTPGIHFVVTNGEGPAVLSTAEIGAIRQMIEGGARVEPHPFLKVGDRVRVKAGPLTGVEGFLVRKKNRFRLVVSVELLGRSAAAEVDASILERVMSGRFASPPGSMTTTRAMAC
jgi:transcription antitermination factor NusG